MKKGYFALTLSHDKTTRMRNLLLTLTCITFIQFSFAQTDSLLAKAKNKDAFEELFVHTDKSDYVSGETIWLKAYLYDGLYPSAQSANLKIQLVNNDSTVVTDKIYPVINGISTGGIKLPLNLAAGRYFLRAVGDASLRNPRVQYYITSLLVYNPAGGKKIDAPPYERVIAAKLHCPNALVAGLGNQVYVSVTDQYRQPMATEGVLLNGSDTVSSFVTNSYGVAEMQIIPSENDVYSVAINNVSNKFLSSAAIHNDGIAMSIAYRDNNYSIFLNATPAFAAKQYKLLAEFNYNVLFSIKATFTNNAASVKIPAAQLPAGIIRLVLLNSNDDAVCERFVFSPNANILMGVQQASASLSLNDTAISSINVVLRDSIENTSSLSALDADFDFGGSAMPENIVNRFLLTGYFKNNTPAYNGLISDVQQADVHLINQVLATQPLLKPSWQDIKGMAAAPKIEEQPLEHITVKGTVSPDGYKRLPGSASLTMLFSMKDSSQSMEVVPLDNNGKFEMNDLVFSDSVKVYYKLNSKTPKDIKMDMQVSDLQSKFRRINDFSFINSYAPVQLVNITNFSNTGIAQKQGQLQASAKDTLAANILANVTVQATRSDRQKLKVVNDRYTSDVFIRQASQTIDLIDEPYRAGLMNVIDYLKYYGREMQISNGNIVKYIGWGAGQPYTLFVDENRAYYETLESIDMRDVALIKIYSTTFVMADNNGPAIAVFLRKGEDLAGLSSTGMQKTIVAGYSASKDFVNTDRYNLHKINRQSLLGTFYWSPYISLANTANESAVKFYNVNKVKTAAVTLQGMASDGRLLFWQQQVTAK